MSLQAMTRVIAASCLLAAFASGDARIRVNDNAHAAGTRQDGLRTIHLVIGEGEWFPEDEHGPSTITQAFGEEGGPFLVPGPAIRVSQGEQLHITLRNALKTPVRVFGLHEHPGDAEQSLDIPPGETREAGFQAGLPGLYSYWAATKGHDLEQRKGPEETLGGVFLVTGPEAPDDDPVYVIQHLNVAANDRVNPPVDGGEYWVINGKMWPYTKDAMSTVGQTIRWRWLNLSYEGHPMHLHGTYFRVLSRNDGEVEKIQKPISEVTTELNSGSSVLMEWAPERPGNWLFHCHITYHVEPLGLGIFRKLAYPDPLALPMGRDPHQHMSGLVMQVKVSSGAEKKTTAEGQQPRRLDLYIRERGFIYPHPKDYPAQMPAVGVEMVEQGKSSGLTAPGPELVLERGTPVEITIHNQMKEQTTIHWHGMELENYYDGVAGLGTDGVHIAPAIPAGGTFVARFTPRRAGTFIYHAHMRDSFQIPDGVSGALIVKERGQPWDPKSDHVLLVTRDGWDDVAAPTILNGSATPAAWDMEAGKSYRLRMINITPANPRTFRLLRSGTLQNWTPMAKDGADLPAAMMQEHPAEVRMMSGETFDFQYTPKAAGDEVIQVWDGSKSKVLITQPLHIHAQ